MFTRLSKGNLLLRTVTSWAIASSKGSGPSPHLARRLRVTKEWKSLSAWRRALWTRLRWNLLRDGRLTPAKQIMDESLRNIYSCIWIHKENKKEKSKEKEERGGTYLQYEGSLSPQSKGQMGPCKRPQGSLPKSLRQKWTLTSSSCQTRLGTWSIYNLCP